MTQKTEKILHLKDTQKRKLEENKKLTKRMWKHLLWILTLIGAYTIYCIEVSHHFYGSVFNFIIITFSIFLLISATYYLFVQKKIKKNLKDIKNINGKLYNLMKLENG
tara:strand:+ start:132 stop:455 length:324 start_codon:yes stop_codon:yes gene_type:complete